MSLIPLTLSLRNFQSFGNNLTTINLQFNDCTLIQGRNLDAIVDGQVDSNGAGKSTIRAAMIWACFNETLNSKLKVGDLINRINKKDMQVIFEFEKDGTFNRIDRYKKLGKVGAKYGGDGVYLLEKNTLDEKWDYTPKAEGGHDITPAASKDVAVEIRKKLGIPFEIFTRILTIAATAKPFLALELSEQRELLEELFSYNELSEKAEILKEDIKNNKTELETLIKLDDLIQVETKRYTDQLTLLTNKANSWNIDHTQRKTLLQNKINEHNDLVGTINFEEEESNLTKVDSLTQEISKLDNNANLLVRDFQTINSTITKIDQWQKSHERELDVLSGKIRKSLVFQTLEEAQECQEVFKIHTQTITTHNEVIAGIDAKLLKEKNSIAAHKKEIVIHQASITRTQAKITELTREITQLSDSKCPYCEQHFANAKDKITDKQAHITEFEKIIEQDNAAIEIETHSITLSTEAITHFENEKRLSVNQKQIALDQHTKYIIGKFGSEKFDFNQEYQNTVNRQKLIEEFKVKEKQTNPFLAESSLDQLETDKLQVSEELNSVTEQINTQKTNKKQLAESLVFRTIKEITSTKILGETLASDLTKLELETNPHLDSLDAHKQNPPSERKANKIQELHTYIEHQEFLLKLLTKKDSFLRKALLNRYTPFLNERIKYYLDKLGLPYKVLFKEDMTVAVSQFKTEVNYASLSLGQQARVNISFPFAFRDVLQKRFGVIPFCMLDEFLDTGLGSSGIQLAIKLIKEISKDQKLSMFVISHRDEVSNMFDSKIMIELKNGFSSIIS